MEQTANSGMGVFATEDINAGDLIVAERPLLVKMAWSPARRQEDMSKEQVLRAVRLTFMTIYISAYVLVTCIRRLSIWRRT